MTRKYPDGDASETCKEIYLQPSCCVGMKFRRENVSCKLQGDLLAIMGGPELQGNFLIHSDRRKLLRSQAGE